MVYIVTRGGSCNCLEPIDARPRWIRPPCKRAMLRFLTLSLAVFCCLCLLACSSGSEKLDPDKMPYKLEQVYQEESFLPIDLNSDGRDERVHMVKTQRGIVLRAHDGQTIKEVNFPEPIQNPHFLDLDGDDLLEILIPFVRNDSLLIQIVDSQGNKKNKFALTDDSARLNRLLYPWDPWIVAFFLADTDDDGHEELISIISTGYAGLPRGVLAHSLPDGSLVGEALIGTSIQGRNVHHGDYDRDGHQEIVMATAAPNNEASAGELDDQHSYLVSFEVSPRPRMKGHIVMGEEYTYAQLRSGDFNGDGENEYLAFVQTQSSAPPGPTRIQLIDPNSLRVHLERKFHEPLLGVAAVNLDRDTRDEILLLGVSGKLEVLNDRLETIMQHQLPGTTWRGSFTPEILSDVDGDGIDEIVVRIDNKAVLLTPRLRVKAVFPVESVVEGLIQRGQNNLPYLYASRNDFTHVYRLVKNPLFLVNRYGPWFLGIIFTGLWLVAGIVVVKFYRKTRQLDRTIRNNVIFTQELQQQKQRMVDLSKRLDEYPEGFLEGVFSEQVNDGFVARVYAVVGNHYSDPHFNVQAFAHEMGCSPRTLLRDLRDKIGCTPQEFIRTFRLERAHQMMVKLSDTTTIAEIAYAVGFKSPGHLSTSFKGEYGLSPSMYMKKHASPNASMSSDHRSV